MNISYTVCYIKRGKDILLLNRNSAPLQGMWNGVGGKVEEGESSRSSVQREVAEETGLSFTKEHFHYKGTISWRIDGNKEGGMDAFLVEVEEDFVYPTPVMTEEGILCWKDRDWILSMDNQGVSPMISYYLPTFLDNEGEIHHHFTIQESRIMDHRKRKGSMDVVVP